MSKDITTSDATVHSIRLDSSSIRCRYVNQWNRHRRKVDMDSIPGLEMGFRLTFKRRIYKQEMEHQMIWKLMSFMFRI